MKYYLTILTFFTFCSICSSQNSKPQKILKSDTTKNGDTLKIKTIVIEEQITQSEYYQELEKILDQKQLHFDSSLNILNWVAGILAVLFTLIIGFGVYLGFNEFRQIKTDLRTELLDVKTQLERDLNSKLQAEAKKIAEDLIIKKYEEDISELKEKTNNLEGFTQAIADSYWIKPLNEKPMLEQERKKAKIKNPFDKS